MPAASFAEVSTCPIAGVASGRRRRNMTTYSTTFYRQVHAQVRDSAREIVPLVTALVQPKRVVDVGRSTGTWLAAFAEHGATEILGLDGDYVDRSLLDIPADRFVAADLAKPVKVAGRYD